MLTRMLAIMTIWVLMHFPSESEITKIIDAGGNLGGPYAAFDESGNPLEYASERECKRVAKRKTTKDTDYFCWKVVRDAPLRPMQPVDRRLEPSGLDKP